MLRIIVVRHGQSVADIEHRLEGRADFELTELGCQQAEKAACWIKENLKPDLIFTSPLKRAAKTAETIGMHTGIEVYYEDALMEWNNGLLAGLTFEEADRLYPLPEGGRKAYHDFAQCESHIDFRARAEKYLARFIDTYDIPGKNKSICLVSHGGMISMLFRSFLGLPVLTNAGLHTGDTGIHLWEASGCSRNVVFSNFLGHLDV